MSHGMPQKPWQFFRADISSINNKHYPCIVNYLSIVLVIKHVEGFSADNLAKACKIMFSEYRLPNEIVNKKACGLKAQPLKNIIPGSGPSANRKLLTHILTNVTTHPAIHPHTDI